MERLPRIFFEVHSRDSNPIRCAVHAIRETAVGSERLLVLGDLVAFREIWVEVVLAGKDRRALDRAAEGQRRPDRILDRPAVEHRKRPRQTEADWADVGIGRGAEFRATTTKDLRVGQQLRVDFEADDGFEIHGTQLSPQSLVLTTGPRHTLGPAALTSGSPESSKALKFSTNIRASLAACMS